ncbi:methyl-accepting chemotaxis protein [Trichlorobacter ammonificans]|uniref:Chemotaxis protein n=1 Tax=Trichlorobacter ammonificans TaxID=2916410 RepID=A0ABM9D9C1_9BACT|nr:methyl-accepting chemotaxis protein [Trichlorobacter ammonificans]CAH2030979.1 Chemotaxis protein [Trichlorobacter ammonificans]
MNISLKMKLFGMTSLMMLLMAVVGGIGLAGFRQSNQELERVFQVNMKNATLLSKIDGLLRASRIQMLLALQHDPSNEFSKLHDHETSLHIELTRKYAGEIAALWNDYYGRIDAAQTRALADAYQKDRQTFHQEGIEPVIAAVEGGDFKEAYHITINTINPTIQKANRSLDALMQHEVSQAEQAHTKSQKKYSLLRTAIIGSILVALVCGFGAGFVIASSIGRSSIELKSAAEKLAGGNLTVRADVSSGDELGVIGQSFNKIADTLQTVMERVRSSSGALTAAAAELRSNAEQIATGAEHVAAQATSVATAGEEMAATSNEIAGSCGMAAERADQACTAATNGVRIVQLTVEGMARIAGKVQDSAKTVESLGERSDQIGQIIGTIEDIADQTNLLALNAAIEAARAGEQGRGFAVVADEVRALAERTTRATREIGEMIKAIQGETRNAVAAMEDGVREVDQGTSDAARSGEALQQILAQVNDVTQQIGQIATAAEEQTATTGEISGNMQKITEVVQDTAGGAQRTAAAAARLSGLAQDLEAIVAQFRLNP